MIWFLLLALAWQAPPSPAAPSPVLVSTKRAADGTHSLVHEVIVDASVADTWRAVSTAEGWKTWAVPVAWSPSPNLLETSYDPSATPGAKSNIRQQVLQRIKGRRFTFRTVKAPAGFPHFDTFTKVTSSFELFPAGKRRTKVRLTGSGYADNAAGKQLLDFFRSGNVRSLESLRARFSEGPADWAKRLSQPPKRP